MRGNPIDDNVGLIKTRSIPACAGEPGAGADGTDMVTVYPRVCGGTRDKLLRGLSVAGLSPRVRGNLIGALVLGVGTGSIPACAWEPR